MRGGCDRFSALAFSTPAAVRVLATHENSNTVFSEGSLGQMFPKNTLVFGVGEVERR